MSLFLNKTIMATKWTTSASTWTFSSSSSSTPSQPVQWPNEIYIRSKPFLATMMLSSSPFLATILILFFVSAVLSRLFTLVRARRHMKQARDQIKMQSFLEIVTYGRTECVDNERTFDEIVGRGEQARIFAPQPPRRRKFAWPNKRKFKSMGDFNLPDEDRCPIELVNDVIAKQKQLNFVQQQRKKSATSQDDSQHRFSAANGDIMMHHQHHYNHHHHHHHGHSGLNQGNVEIDQEVMQIINDLIRPQEPNEIDELMNKMEAASTTSSSPSSSSMSSNSFKLNPLRLFTKGGRSGGQTVAAPASENHAGAQETPSTVASAIAQSLAGKLRFDATAVAAAPSSSQDVRSIEPSAGFSPLPSPAPEPSGSNATLPRSESLSRRSLSAFPANTTGTIASIQIVVEDYDDRRNSHHDENNDENDLEKTNNSKRY